MKEGLGEQALGLFTLRLWHIQTRVKRSKLIKPLRFGLPFMLEIIQIPITIRPDPSLRITNIQP